MQRVLDCRGGDGDVVDNLKDCTAKMWSAEFEQRAPSHFCVVAGTGGDGARGDGAVLRGGGVGPKGDGAGPEALALAPGAMALTLEAMALAPKAIRCFQFTCMFCSLPLGPKAMALALEAMAQPPVAIALTLPVAVARRRWRRLGGDGTGPRGHGAGSDGAGTEAMALAQ